MATGQNDPERRERIIAAALVLIAEKGLLGPRGAGVTRFSSSIVAVFEEHLAAASTTSEAREAVADLVHHLSSGSQRGLVLIHELYTLAARNPAYRELIREWMRRSRAALERHFDPATTRQLDAMIEGLSYTAPWRPSLTTGP